MHHPDTHLLAQCWLRERAGVCQRCPRTRLCPACRMLQCSFFEHRAYKIVYRRYASLFFMVGVDDDEVRGAGARARQACGRRS